MGNKEDNEAVVDEKLLPDEVETEHASSVLDILRDAEGHAVTVDGQNNIKPSDGGSEEREDRNEEMVAQAATKIQASFRGMKVRRRFTNTKIDGFTTDDVVETILDGHVDANE
jgi:predicted dinucleotide-binding enzyme